MDQTYRSLADCILSKWEEKKAKAATANGTKNSTPRLIVAVAGPPGSGKTTIANKVVDIINSLPSKSPKTIVVSADGFHLPLATLRKLPNASEALARRGAPWTFDGHAAVSLVRKLKTNTRTQPVLAPTFDHAIKDPVSDGLLIEPDVDILWTTNGLSMWNRIWPAGGLHHGILQLGLKQQWKEQFIERRQMI
ncbi:phosphoribulokinase/uridine kinase [Trichoderma harzianum]|uniref:Phosphoribulokinase/uridine kinase n=1 Tax=Trichoderma harzianum TaxID=5544 RepID=A0A0F9X3S4_TRIHA|nr:phosphoribulokinase/uridine kinase [Trichoderma harzianum]